MEGNPFSQKIDNPFELNPTINNIDDIIAQNYPDGLEAEMEKMVARDISQQKRDVEFNEEFNKKFAGVIGMMEEGEEFREKVTEYFKILDPLVNVYPQDKNFEEIINYLKKRNAVELEKISDGKNPEVEKRYDRYVDYG